MTEPSVDVFGNDARCADANAVWVFLIVAPNQTREVMTITVTNTSSFSNPSWATAFFQQFPRPDTTGTEYR